jgi:tetratricopeptide (TPR) repeat protein
MWAIAYLNELQQQPKLHKASILKLGLQYRLLTNETSLLVLDDIQDYVEQGIVPPKSLQKKYKILRAKYLKEKKDEQAEHWKALKSDWKEYLKWYANPNYEMKRPSYPLDEGVVIGVQETYGNAATLSEVPPAVSNEAEEAHVSQELQSSANDAGFASGAQTFNWTNENNFTISPSGSSTGSFGVAATSLSPSSISSYSLSISNGNATAANGQNVGQSTLKLAAWNPKTPYLKQLKRVPASKIYQNYLLLRPAYQDQPSFYIDVCDFFMKKKQYANAVRVLSNLAEMQIQDPSLLRLLAQRLLQMKETKLALELFEQIIKLRPEEPQSYRDLGLALEATGQFQKAIEQLYKVVKNPYDHRFEGIHMIVLNEINHIVNRHPKGLDLKFIDPIFLKKLPFDVRVVLNWDADDTDVDLWVNEPGGEKCMYSYQRTENGGRISNDFTQGFGPEEYLIKKAPNGSFRIQAHYYGNHRPSLNGKAQLTVQFYLHYGTPFEIKREVTRRLQTVDEEIDLATFEFDN